MRRQVGLLTAPLIDCIKWRLVLPQPYQLPDPGEKTSRGEAPTSSPVLTFNMELTMHPAESVNSTTALIFDLLPA